MRLVAMMGVYVDVRSSTHVIELGPDVVVKRYRSRRNDEPRREWRALTLLHEHAPDVAPVPISADLDVEPHISTTERYLHTLPTADETALEALAKIRANQGSQDAASGLEAQLTEAQAKITQLQAVLADQLVAQHVETRPNLRSVQLRAAPAAVPPPADSTSRWYRSTMGYQGTWR
ncbi:hypothetical protein [Actinomadura monticuli]|uniref:Uncharacterized protein n=1 Tax=Actinomadura monticuli TaxID=3097367 RepID=A0ABV4Q983_9ACTN